MDNLISQPRTARRSAMPLQFGVPLLTAAALIVILYWTTFSWWWTEWTAPGSFYAHAVFVPFFVCVMIWRNRERLAVTPWVPSWLGIPLIVAAMGLLMLAQRGDVTIVKSLSFILLMLGGSLLLIGIPRTRVLLFPLLFIVMMMPLIPDQLINNIAFPIQMASASLATKLLNLMTLTSNQQGTMIQMESYRMAVELPCSGFKTLVSLVTFSAAFAYLVEAATWKRWALFLTTVPLSLVINALRITFIGMVGELVSAKAAATFHDYSGFIVLIMAFLFLFNFARVLRCDNFLGVPLEDEPKPKKGDSDKSDNGGGMPETPVRAANPAPVTPWYQPILAWRPTEIETRRVLPFVIAINLILLTSLAVQGYVIKPVVPKSPIATVQVPKEFTQDGVTYQAQDGKEFDKLPKDVQEVLSPTRVINRDYSGTDGVHTQVFITAGNGRKVFHDPHTCSLGSDAVLSDVGVAEIPTQLGTLRVQESRYKHTGMNDEFEMFFFYVVEGKIVQRTEQVRNSMISQMLLGDSGKPSYFVRVIQQMPGTDAQKRQQTMRFIAGLWNNVGPVLTGQKDAIYEPPPVPMERSLLMR